MPCTALLERHVLLYLSIPNYLQVIPGNSDTRTAELRVLDAPLVLRRLRVVPLSNSTRTVCLRLELYGCPYEGTLPSNSLSRQT